MNTFLTYYFNKSQKVNIRNFEMLDQIWKRRAPINDETPCKNLGNHGDEINIYQKHEIQTWYIFENI